MSDYRSNADEGLANELGDIFRAQADVELPGRLVDRVAAIPERAPSTSRSLLRSTGIALLVVFLAVSTVVLALPRFLPASSQLPCTGIGPSAAPTVRGPTPTPYPATPSATGPTTPLAAGGFRSVASMTTARDDATAVTLKDGRVLILGGTNNDGALASAELYDPATCTFSATASMPEARTGFTATLLQDGRVLVAGGWVPNHAVAEAMLFDPSSGSFTTTGSMATARSSHSATLLPDGQVLIAGGASDSGSNPSTVLASAELYDPRTGRFASTGSMSTRRIGEAVALLSDGKVLFAGGNTGAGFSGDLSSAELYDPSTGAFSPTGSMLIGWGESATVLQDGRVLILGEKRNLPIGSLPALLPSAELYDPSTGTFAMTGAYTAPGGTATLLHDGKVLVLGGSLGDAGPHSEGVAVAQVYDPASGTFSRTASMTVVRAGPAVALLADGVLVAGGDGRGEFLSSAEVFEP